MIVKEKLALLPMCYCITVMEYNGRKYCISASEDRGGEIVMIDTQTKDVSKITGLAGGVMAIIPVPEQNGMFLAIQKFYPVFDSKKAEVVCCTISGEIKPVMEAEVRLSAQIPYVHRIALAGKPGARKLIAGILCSDKDFVDDWSKPGLLAEHILDENFQSVYSCVLRNEITKHHGMYTYEKKGGSYLLISGEEGVFAVDEKGNVSILCPESVSDLCMYDVDGDGMDEMICIAPFHGDHMKILKRSAQGWDCMADEPITFGHAIWCGECGGSPIVISCSRGGDKCTRIYRPSWKDGKLSMETMDADEGVGASNIYVEKAEDGAVVLYAANHGVGEVARYTIDL